MQALENFKAALTASDLKVLQQCLREAKQPVPVHALPWYLGDAPEATGYLVHEHANLLKSLRPDWTTLPKGLCWDTPEKTPPSRNMALAQLAEELRTQGQITGWRDEKFSFWLDEQAPSDRRKEPDPLRAEAFRMERAAFRFFGLRSHAVHINGFTPDGRMWCARRALSKATDPGRLDNLAAGGLAADETILQCAVRELGEEAGLAPSLAQHIQRAGRITTARTEPEGWHDETLLVFNLYVPEAVVPHNTDGEVSEFVCLTPAEVMQRIQAADFSKDAACVIAQGILNDPVA
jgi:8-oxo-dGTP pyrophosphatase MutT (NUDIX family)